MDEKGTEEYGRAPQSQNSANASLAEDAMAGLTKMIAIQVDVSENALKSLDYLDLIYGPEDNLEINI